MDTFAKLRSSKGLSENEREIVAYILDNPEEVTRISSRELARRTLTSPTAILRLSRKLGFENFNDFKVNIASNLKRTPMQDTDIKSKDNALAVLNKLAELETNVIARVRDTTSPSKLTEVANLIARCQCLDFCAHDSLAKIAACATHQFMVQGIMTNLFSELDRTVYFSLVAPKDHVVVFLSRSGTDKTLCAAARNLKEHGVPTVALTANGHSELGRICDYVFELYFAHGAEHQGDVVFATGAKYVLDCLAALTYSEDYEDVTSLVGRYSDLYYSQLDRAHAAGDDAVTGPPEVQEL